MRVLDNRYQLIRPLGHGSMGQVYLVYDTRLKKHWAVKEVAANVADLFPEWDILKDLDHPVLPHVVDVFQKAENYYFVMDYVEGRNLKELCRDGVKFRQIQLLDWGIELAGILAFLHRQTPPILHRDMKPSNIIIQPDGGLKLIDFGISIRSHQVSEEKKGWGTQGFASREQLSGREDMRADIYSLGAVLLYLLKNCRGNVNRRFLHCIDKCMQQDVKKRYQTAEELEQALGDVKKYLLRNKRLRTSGLVSLLIGCVVLEVCVYEIVREQEERNTLLQVQSILDNRQETVWEDMQQQLSIYSSEIDWASMRTLMQSAEEEIKLQDTSYMKAEQMLTLANYYMSYGTELQEGEEYAYWKAEALLQEGLEVAKICPGKTLSKAYELEFLLGLFRLYTLNGSEKAAIYPQMIDESADNYIRSVKGELHEE